VAGLVGVRLDTVECWVYYNGQVPCVIKRLELQNIRRIADASIQFEQFAVLAGPNGSGKSSVFVAVELLRAAALGKLQETLGLMNGAQSVARQGGSVFSIVAEYEKARVELSIAARLGGYEIVAESLRHSVDGRVVIMSQGVLSRTLGKDGAMQEQMSPRQAAMETALANAPPWLEWARAPFRRCHRYQAIPVHDGAEVVQRQQFGLTSSPGLRGEALGAALYSLQQRDRDRFLQLEDSLRAAFPEFKELKFPYIGSNSMALQWVETQGGALEIGQMSSGSVRFLWLLSILYGSEDGSVVLIDEPELSLHPKLVGYAVDLCREASERIQVVLATQSETLIRCLRPAELIVSGLSENAEAMFQPASALDLEAWLQDFSMERLWMMGQLEPRT